MAALTPSQLRTRRRVETLIRLMAPALDVVLAVGDRVSRIVERDDPEYYPPRVGRHSEGPAPPLRRAPRAGGEGPHRAHAAPPGHAPHHR
jgi:hypothetical protein